MSCGVGWFVTTGVRSPPAPDSAPRYFPIPNGLLADGGSPTDRTLGLVWHPVDLVQPEPHGISVVSCELVMLGLVISESHVDHSRSQRISSGRGRGVRGDRAGTESVFTLLANVISEHNGFGNHAGWDEILAVWPVGFQNPVTALTVRRGLRMMTETLRQQLGHKTHQHITRRRYYVASSCRGQTNTASPRGYGERP